VSCHAQTTLPPEWLRARANGSHPPWRSPRRHSARSQLGSRPSWHGAHSHERLLSALRAREGRTRCASLPSVQSQCAGSLRRRGLLRASRDVHAFQSSGRCINSGRRAPRPGTRHGSAHAADLVLPRPCPSLGALPLGPWRPPAGPGDAHGCGLAVPELMQSLPLTVTVPLTFITFD
jgi:hypothetical protein